MTTQPTPVPDDPAVREREQATIDWLLTRSVAEKRAGHHIRSEALFEAAVFIANGDHLKAQP